MEMDRVSLQSQHHPTSNQSSQSQAIEKRAVIVLADISGYTKFMVDTQMSAIHGQQCITFLIETLIREIDIPLRLQEIEGDALFLYAEDPGSDEEWARVLEQIPAKLMRFFDAFYEGTVLSMEASPCACSVCSNSRELALKIIVHSGRAVFHKIGGFDKVSGSDVILAHRLLKNSVPDDEYLLLSKSAYLDIGSRMEGPFVESSEHYDQFGKVETFVRYNKDVKQTQRDALFNQSSPRLFARAEVMVGKDMMALLPALLRHLYRPANNRWNLRARLGFVLSMLLRSPLVIMRFIVQTPRRLFSNRAARLATESVKSAPL